MAKKIEVNENWEPVEVEDLDNLFVVIFKQGSFDQGYVEAFDTDDVLMQSAYDSLTKQYGDCGCDELTKIYLIKVPNTDQTVDMCNTGLFNGNCCDPHVIEATRDLFNRADCEQLSCWEGCGLTEAKKKKNIIPSGYLTITTGDPALNIKHFNKCMGTDGLGDSADHPHLIVGDTLPNGPVAGESGAEPSGNAGDSIGDGGAIGESLNEGASSAIDAIAAKYDAKLDCREKTNDKTKYFIEVPFKDKRYWRIWDELKTLNPESMDSWKTGIVVILDAESKINFAENKQITESSGFSYFYEQLDKMQKLENRLNGDRNPATSRDFNAKAASDGKLKINREICIEYGLWKALKVVEDEMIRRNLIPSYYKVKKDRIDMSIIVDAAKLKAIADLLFLFNANELNEYIDKNVNKSFEDAICILLITLRSNNAKISTEIKDKILSHYDITVQELINILQKNLNAAKLADVLSTIPAAQLKEDLKLYRYNGPVYVGGNKVIDIWDDSSKAVSPEKALNNIRYKAGKKLGDDGIELVPEYLSIINTEDDSEMPTTALQEPIKKCKDCGAILMDSGECPNCDYGDSSALELDESDDLLEAKRYVKRYYVRPLNIFCGNKEDIIQALIRAGDQNCSVYSLKNLDNHEDVHLLQPSDIIYYWDDRVLYDKNHVQVMDYDLFVKHEEERKKVGNVDALSDATFSDMYDDRATEDDLKDKEVIANYKALNKISR